MSDAILAIDTTGPHCAAALVVGDDVRVTQTEPMAKGQAERLMPMLEEVLLTGGQTWSDLDTIAVATGPGNFTGARIGVAAARGLAFALEIPAVGISVLEALAFGRQGRLLSLVDARQGAVYAQVFTDGCPEAAPTMCLPNEIRADGPPLCVAGHDAAEIAGLLQATALDAPAHPLPETFAFAAAAFGSAGRSPAKPLYIRPPDAAPSRIVPPLVRA